VASWTLLREASSVPGVPQACPGVAYLERAPGGEQQVLRLEVAVHHTPAVHVVQGLDEGPQDLEPPTHRP